ncbi:MAG: DUF3048 domain-containing protein [Acidimicrobiia bacterium]
MSQRTKILVIAAAVVALLAATGGVLAAAGGGDDKEKKETARTTSTSTTTPATTTTTPPIIAPLTGLVDPSGASATRPALSVKIDNTVFSRPHTGIDQADVVYEEVVEGNITRLVAMFNSSVPEYIGPVRSVRAEDPDIVWPLGGIFAFSGGAQVNVNAIRNAPVHVVDETAAQQNGAMIRNAPGQPPRDAPFNLYAIGPKMFELGGEPVPSPALFQYLPADAPPVGGSGVLSTRIGFIQGYDPTWIWDAGSRTWKRTIQGQPYTVVGGAQIAVTNVVVQFTRYDGESEGQTVGEGDLWVFTDGVLRVGKWVRPDRAQPAKYFDAFGNPLHLRAGRTWVELLPAGAPVDVEAAPPPATVATTVPPPTTTTQAKKKNK